MAMSSGRPMPSAVRSSRRVSSRAGRLDAPQCRNLAQIREPAVHRILQGARRAQQAAVAGRRSERQNGVIAMSAGNHAQGVAYHALGWASPRRSSCRPTTPTIKVEKTRSHGAEVILEGKSSRKLRFRAFAYGAERGMTFVHPFNDQPSSRDRERSQSRCWRSRPISKS